MRGQRNPQLFPNTVCFFKVQNDVISRKLQAKYIQEIIKIS